MREQLAFDFSVYVSDLEAGSVCCWKMRIPVISSQIPLISSMAVLLNNGIQTRHCSSADYCPSLVTGQYAFIGKVLIYDERRKHFSNFYF